MTRQRPCRVIAAVILLAVTLSACRESPAPPPPVNRAPAYDPARFDGARALEETERFARLGPKVSGTPGAARAAAYIAERLAALGLMPLTDAFEATTPAGPVVFRNIMAELPGRRTNTIVLACHYDTKSGISDTFHGANDSASGVGLLLEMARVLHEAPGHEAAILLAFLDGEECQQRYRPPEDGLHGSSRLAQTMVMNRTSGRVLGVFVVDMVGDRDLTVTLPRNSTPSLVAVLLAAAEIEGARTRFSLSSNEIVDDHVPFLRAGMPAIDIIDFEYGPTPGSNAYWHTPEDTLDKLSADSLHIVGRVLVRSVVALQ